MRVVLPIFFLGTIAACQVLNSNRSEMALAGSAAQDSGRGRPPAVVAKNCNSAPSKDELPKERFARKGGREAEVPVRSERGALTVDGVEEGRDLTRYERLDLLNPEPMFASQMDRDATVVRARTFLWEHWKRKPGYVTLTGSSVDATSTSHIFVEEEEPGRWRVAWRIVRHTGVIHDLPTYYAVEWVWPGVWRQPGRPLASGEHPDAKKHKLEFRDKWGDVEQSL